MKINYPKVRKDEIEEEKFGVLVADPYRWLEDEQSEETAKFIEEQMAVTKAYLDKIPAKEKIKDRLTELYNYEKYGGAWVSKEKILFTYSPGLQNQPFWYLQDGLEGEEELLLDPNSLSEEGTVAATLLSPSADNRYVTYLVSEAGSDWQSLKVLDLTTKEPLEDELNWVKFTWTAWEGDGFYYSGYSAPEEGRELSAINENMRVYYHKLGDKQENDRLVYEDPAHPLRYNSLRNTEDKKQKILTVSEGTYGDEILLFDEEKESFIPLLEGFHADRHFLDKYENQLLFLTDEEAPNRKIIAYDLEKKEFTDFLKEADHSLENAVLIGDYLVLAYLVDVASELRILNLKTGEEEKLDLPELGNVFLVSGSEELGGFFYTFGSLSSPLTNYFYSFATKETSVFKKSELAIDTSDFVTERHFVEASDGAKIPLFLMYKKGLKKDGTNPTLLYAYGGFSASTQLNFKLTSAYIVDRGGIYAQANIRGGDEYGDTWHRQGMLLNKQRVFDDFIECSEYLIEQGYSSSEKLAIEGASNGGLLMGAVMNQRPDLYRVVFPCVGVMDMLRYHLFTVGWGWIPEFGSPDEEIYFKYLLKYSPLHNIEEKDYPSVMIRTADHDDRVVPAHSFKYGAALQEKNTSDNPILLRIDKDAGHGAGKSLEKIIDEQVDKFAFLFYEMGR